MPTINISAHFDDLEGAQAVLETLGANASRFTFMVSSDHPSEPEADLTPPQGISRADVDHAVGVHISALVAWTIENITSGPLVDVPRMVLRTAYRRLIEDGDDASLDDLKLTPVQVSRARGAFKDAQAGMVPL